MNQIKKLRKQARLSQGEFCHLCGWTESSGSRISNYENGISTPTLNDCRAIVKALNASGIECSLDDVFPPSDDKFPLMGSNKTDACPPCKSKQ